MDLAGLALALVLAAADFLGAAVALAFAGALEAVFTAVAEVVFLGVALAVTGCFFALAGLTAVLRLTVRVDVSSAAFVLVALERRALAFVLISRASDSIRVVSCWILSKRISSALYQNSLSLP